MNNVHIVNIARELVLCGIKEKEATIDSQQRDQLNDSLNYTFILPDINHYPSDFKAFLHKDLIETSTLVSLEQAGQFFILFLKTFMDYIICSPLFSFNLFFIILVSILSFFSDMPGISCGVIICSIFKI